MSKTNHEQWGENLLSVPLSVVIGLTAKVEFKDIDAIVVIHNTYMYIYIYY